MNFMFVIRKLDGPDEILSRIHFTLGVPYDELANMYHPRYFMNYPCIHKVFTIDLTTRAME